MTDPQTVKATLPSAKAVGKKPVNVNALFPTSSIRGESSTPAPPASTPGTPSKSGMQTRQKRVLPSRSRRGGPGVGNCDVDVMILETRKRRLETEPLIPSETKFLLTTDSTLVPSSSDGLSAEAEINIHAYGRYFDRPEVQTACREQQIIQTPEFTQLDDATVGGRFRPRGSEDETADTSDAAYEKRHRKYETFEKRQRLREKEKLKHEQYKLKERIEQLRGMETSAFLALPASSFSEPPGVTHEGGYDENDTGISDLPGAHVNGAAAYNEGERRRKEMLDIAQVLEERYRVLLPPDRKWAEKKEKARLESASFSVESETDRLPEKVPERASTRVPEPRRFFEPMRLPTPEEEQSSVEVDELAADDEEPEPPRPAPQTAHRHDSDGESEVDFEERDRQRSKLLKLRIKVPPKMIPPKGPELAQTLPQIVPSKKKHKKSHTIKRQLSAPGAFSFPSFSPAQVRSISAKPGTIIRSADGKFLPKHKRFQGSLDELVPPSKRHRANSSASAAQTTSPTKPHTAHPHGAHSPTKTPCALMIAAQRSSATPTARKTQRHVLAFGVRVPDDIEQVRDYEVPEWCFPESHRMSDDTGEWEVGAGLSENGPGSPEIGDPEWYQEFQDTKDDFPEIATLD